MIATFTNLEVLCLVLSCGAMAGLFVWGCWTIDEQRQDALNKLFPRSKPKDDQ